MYWDPVAEKLIDRVGGRDDLEKGIIRSIGNPIDRFQEDHIRILRAVRFAARLDFCIEPTTKKAIKKTAHMITRVAAERIREEVEIILTDLRPASGLRLMDELGILEEIFPELEATKGCEQPENYHPEGDVFVHTTLAVEKLGPTPPFTLCMATMLHDIGKPKASRDNPGEFPEHERIGEDISRQICRRLRIPKKETERICWLVKRHMYFKDADKMKKSTLKRLFSEKAFPQLCELARVDAAASWGKYEHIECVLTIREQLLREELLPPPLITGDDLISMGYTPGPAFGKILGSIREKQLNGHIQTKGAALKLARQLAKSFDSPSA
jgi:poly(A) polymerase